MDGVTIASSVLTMNRAVRNARAFAGLNLVDLARMGSLLPAQVCGVGDRKGSIEEGKDADLAVFDSEFNTCQTVIAGEVVWQT
jgi:N-acetylglucosamine-6-phosphate deacetylase